MSATSNANVYFVGVARTVGPSIIIASYSHNNTTDLGAVKQVLDQPTNQFVPGQHYNFSSGGVDWHIIPGKFKFV